jgi:hypothetical protein
LLSKKLSKLKKKTIKQKQIKDCCQADPAKYDSQLADDPIDESLTQPAQLMDNPIEESLTQPEQSRNIFTPAQWQLDILTSPDGLMKFKNSQDYLTENFENSQIYAPIFRAIDAREHTQRSPSPANCSDTADVDVNSQTSTATDIAIDNDKDLIVTQNDKKPIDTETIDDWDEPRDRLGDAIAYLGAIAYNSGYFLHNRYV